MTARIDFYENELVPKNQGGQSIGVVQLALVLIAIVIMFVTAGPEPSDLITFAILILLETALGGIKNSGNRFSDSTVEKLAQFSDEEIKQVVGHKHLNLALRQVREWEESTG